MPNNAINSDWLGRYAPSPAGYCGRWATTDNLCEHLMRCSPEPWAPDGILAALFRWNMVIFG
jgi:hypothetical protein